MLSCVCQALRGCKMKVNVCGGGVVWEEVLIVCGLFAVQCVFGGYMVFLNRLLALGIPSLFIIAVACAASSAVVFPFAVAMERKKWPKKWSPVLVFQLVTIALAGVAIYQVLMMRGVERTSPAIASAMPNLGPGLIFIISSCLMFERFDWSCQYSRAKILGTFVCLGGAMCLSFLRNPSSSISPKSPPRKGDNDWIIGCLYLLAGVTVFACNTVLQTATLMRLPAPLTVCAATSMLGSVFSTVIQVAMEGKMDAGALHVGARVIGEIVLVGGGVVGLCTTFQTWSLGRKGPVVVSMFSPFQTVFSAIISAIFFGQWIGLGSSVGIVLMFLGLYVVLWAKNREEKALVHGDDDSASECDIERPFIVS